MMHGLMEEVGAVDADEMAEMRRKKSYAGRLGALANLEKYGRAAVGRRRYDGRCAKIAAEIDPQGLLSPSERGQRVQYRITADLVRATEERRRRRADRQAEQARERAYGRTEVEMNASIKQMAHSVVICVHCTPKPWPEKVSGGICNDCAAKVLRSVA